MGRPHGVPVRTTLFALALAALTAMAFAPAASAAPKTMAGFIGGATPGTGGGGTFNQPRDVAVYEGTDLNPATDKIFVVEAQGQNQRVQRLDVEGNFERMWGKDVLAKGSNLGAEICTVAVDCQFPPGSGETPAVGTAPGEFNDPMGIAVDQVSGWVYIYDRDNKRIQKFDLNGNFLLMFGDNVNATDGTDVCTAADVTSGDVCGTGTGGTSVGQIGPAGTTSNQVRGLAIDPVTSDVFVADPSNRRIERFNSDGTLDASPVLGSAGTGLGQFGTNQPLHLAVDSSGIVYASDSNSSNRVNRYNSATSTAIAAIATPPLLSAPTVGLEIDPDADGPGADEEHLLVGRDPSSGDTVVQEFDVPATPTDPILAAQLIDTHTYAPQAINGLGVSGGIGAIYLAVSYNSSSFPQCAADLGGSGSCAGLSVLSLAPAAPTGAIFAPIDVEATQAVLSGSVDAKTGVASYRFQVSDTGIADDWEDVGEQHYVAGSGAKAVTVTAIGLEPNTPYRSRLIITKYRGLAVGTKDQVITAEANFITDAAAPVAVTAPIGPRTDTGAELRGTVDPNGSATTYFFQYGTTTSYGTNVPSFSASAGSGNAPLPVAQPIAGLQPSSTYHYRVVADGFGPPVFGADQTFVTKPTPAEFLAQGQRGAELVTPPVKMTGPGVGGHGSNSRLDGEMSLLSGIASPSGDRLVSKTQNGPVLTGGATVVVNDVVLSEREPSGWVSNSAFTRQNYSTLATVPFLELTATNGDLSLMTFDVTGGSTLLFPEMNAPAWYAVGATPKYLRDWSGKWELLQPTDPVQGNGGSGGETVALSADGALSAFSNDLQGVLGASDPSLDQVDGRTTYLQDVSAGLTDTFAGSPRLLLGVCSGAGADRTLIPERLASGKLAAQACPAPNPGRSATLTSSRGAVLATTTGRDHSVRNIVSADGFRLFFMSPDPSAPGTPNACSTATGPATACPPQLFVSVKDGGGERAVRWISKPAVANQDASLLGPTYFEGASADGDKVFFRTTSPLTADDPNGLSITPTDPRPIVTGSASANSWDLYMYDFTDDPGDDPGAGALTRISAGPTGNADANLGATGNTGGSLRFVSTDGARSYFATRAPLPGVPATADGTITSPAGTPTTTSAVNLYYYDTAKPLAQRWQFVALLPSGEGIAACASTAAGSGQSRTTRVGSGGFGYSISPSKNCLRGTDDGRFITFWTDGRLTADDPDAITGDMYGFDAEAEDLMRLSASQGGVGGVYPCRTMTENGSALPPDEQRSCFGDGGFISGEPDRWSTAFLGVATQPSASGDRIAYFQSRSQLVIEDLNDEMDVYQWRNGDLSLVSSGAADSEGSYYSGNSADGQDVFIVTRDVLTWQDIDGVRDVYDLRIGGGIPEPLSPPACQVLADGCQAAPTGVPATASASTAVFQGSGNVVEKPKPRRCVKGKVRRKGKCVTKSAKRTANKTRRAGK